MTTIIQRAEAFIAEGEAALAKVEAAAATWISRLGGVEASVVAAFDAALARIDGASQGVKTASESTVQPGSQGNDTLAPSVQPQDTISPQPIGSATVDPQPAAAS